jgi:hypothetical protein
MLANPPSSTPTTPAIDGASRELLQVFFEEADTAGNGVISTGEFDCILEILEIGTAAREEHAAEKPESGWTLGDLLAIVSGRVAQGGYDLGQVLQGSTDV